MKKNAVSRLKKIFCHHVFKPLTVTTLACVPLTALAQSLPASLYAPGATDLPSTIQQTIISNPSVNAAWANFSASGSDVRVAQGNYLPTIDISAGVGRQDQQNDGRGSYSSDFAELTLTQMVFDGFATRSEVERLDRTRLIAYFELLGASEEVTLEAFQTYLDVLRYREMVRLAQENYREHQRVFTQIEERALSGAGRGVDLEQISGRLALAESNLMTEASNLHDVTARYQRIVGELPAQNMSPAPSLADELPTDVSQAVEMAFAGNPDFHAAIENIAVQRAEQGAAKAAFMPRLDIQGRTGTNNQDDSIAGRSDEHSIQLVASMNLYRGGSDSAAFDAASTRIEQAVNQRETACTNVRQTTQIAYNDTLRLGEQLSYLNEHRQSINRVRGAYQQQFDIGQRTLLDVLDSENEYFEASRAFANAEFDLTLAQARTLAAMGQLMSTLEVVREDIPSLDELGYDDITLSAEMACGVEGPRGFTLDDFTRGISSLPAHADMPASSYAANEQPVISQLQETAISSKVMHSPTAENGLYIQVASLSALERAEQLSAQLSEQLDNDARVYAFTGNYRVQIGPIPTLNSAQELQQTLQGMGYGDAFVTNG
ncbi:TolC family outer membrane protein [Halomonas sp. ISL-60]|uniref:TolC family outer membrane protein n=1 Tax=unclassified Halomonas TaxID=2609666 RepID=UPI0007D90F75|nr:MULTISPECIES: TolC family outer membrane protein [unclassified Halomonas]MBT2773554.1 TolC family outer membrane protein [Halomonas sp. ISL-60]MBT2785408.1 TolC family outer membrane protein [Halomonas sp. ISL-106]MBT2797908.1 TolC family outer membrane protein [Halomonas sp. ISL-104]MBT2803834.1 TolC family outer membrane protein [Halomonas sp. ISL-56]OAL59261.1 agglutination protein [Halomonas sp. ALS9]